MNLFSLSTLIFCTRYIIEWLRQERGNHCVKHNHIHPNKFRSFPVFCCVTWAMFTLKYTQNTFLSQKHHCQSAYHCKTSLFTNIVSITPKKTNFLFMHTNNGRMSQVMKSKTAVASPKQKKYTRITPPRQKEKGHKNISNDCAKRLALYIFAL